MVTSLKKIKDLKFILISCVLLYFLSFSLGYFLGFGKFSNSFGMNDFRFFYIAILVMLKGLNPYEPEILNHFADSFNLESNLLSVYPPFTYALLSLFGFMSPRVASLFWFSLNVVFVYLFSIISWRLIGGVKPSLMEGKRYFLINHFLPFILSLTSSMVMICLRAGQMSLFLTLMISLIFLGIKENNQILIGVSLGLLIIKPTSCIIFGVVVFLFLVYNKKYLTLIYSLIPLSILFIIANYFKMGIFTEWIKSREDTFLYAISSRHAVIGDFIQDILLNYTSHFYEFPVLITPIIGVIISVLYLLKHKDESLIYNLPPILCISSVFAPTGWIYDYSISMVTVLISTSLAFKEKTTKKTRDKILRVFVLYNFLSLLFLFLDLNVTHRFVIVLFILSYWFYVKNLAFKEKLIKEK